MALAATGGLGFTLPLSLALDLQQLQVHLIARLAQPFLFGPGGVTRADQMEHIFTDIALHHLLSAQSPAIAFAADLDFVGALDDHAVGEPPVELGIAGNVVVDEHQIFLGWEVRVLGFEEFGVGVEVGLESLVLVDGESGDILGGFGGGPVLAHLFVYLY